MTERLSLIPKPILTLRREEILDELVIDEHRAPHIRIKQYDTLRFLTLRRLGDVRLDARDGLHGPARLADMLDGLPAAVSWGAGERGRHAYMRGCGCDLERVFRGASGVWTVHSLYAKSVLSRLLLAERLVARRAVLGLWGRKR